MIASFRPAAEDKLIKAAAWYLQEGGQQVAEDFEWAVGHALRLLTGMPSLGTPAYRNSRLCPLKPFEYTLVYRVVSDELVVLAVAHQRRAAGYWRGRS